MARCPFCGQEIDRLRNTFVGCVEMDFEITAEKIEMKDYEIIDSDYFVYRVSLRKPLTLVRG